MSTGLFGRISKISSCNEILPRLYLGDINTALNRDELTRLGITDMVTVEVKPIAPELLPPSIQRYLYINVMDHTKQDLLSHFSTSNEFIEKALKNPSNKVYVHCVAGVSRSATLVIAYIMKTRCMSFQEARDLVHQKRRVIDPNEGFVCQLVLYHQMNYKIDIGNLRYRRLVFEALVFEFRLVAIAFYQQNSRNAHINTNNHLNGILSNKVILNMLPSSFGLKSSNSSQPVKNNVTCLFEQFFNKLHLQEVKHYPETYDTKSAYKCNKCRSIVFFPISLIENHTFNNEIVRNNEAIHQINRNDQISETTAAMEKFSLKTALKPKPKTSQCPFYFIEPQPWMIKYIGEREGLLECYKCKKKLGKFDWNSRESCSCELHNSHLNINLFKIMRKHVELGLPSLTTINHPSDQTFTGASTSGR